MYTAIKYRSNDRSKGQNTGNEYRIFVDAYSLDIVEDETATETEPGVWSIYEHRLKNGVEEHLKEWQESDQLQIGRTRSN